MIGGKHALTKIFAVPESMPLKWRAVLVRWLRGQVAMVPTPEGLEVLWAERQRRVGNHAVLPSTYGK